MCGTEICTPYGNAAAGIGTFCDAKDATSAPTCSICPEANGLKTGVCTPVASPACSVDRINTGDFCFCEGKSCVNETVLPAGQGTFCAPLAGGGGR